MLVQTSGLPQASSLVLDSYLISLSLRFVTSQRIQFYPVSQEIWYSCLSLDLARNIPLDRELSANVLFGKGRGAQVEVWAVIYGREGNQEWVCDQASYHCGQVQLNPKRRSRKVIKRMPQKWSFPTGGGNGVFKHHLLSAAGWRLLPREC